MVVRDATFASIVPELRFDIDETGGMGFSRRKPSNFLVVSAEQNYGSIAPFPFSEITISGIKYKNTRLSDGS